MLQHPSLEVPCSWSGLGLVLDLPSLRANLAGCSDIYRVDEVIARTFNMVSAYLLHMHLQASTGP